MLDYLKGILTFSSPNKITVENQGVGYAILIPLSTFAKLPAVGQSVQIFLSFVVREDSQRYFGFFDRAERELFEKFNDVSGIGPKTSLALIGHLPFSELCFAIQHGDVKSLHNVPGIGKKTAERLIVELKDKLSNWGITPHIEASSTETPKSQLASDAISALVNLGYAPAQAHKAINGALKSSSSEPSLAQLITAALRNL